MVVPKADDPALLESVRRSLGRTVGLVALVESARGVVKAHDLAGSRAVDRLAFGSIDFAVDVDATEGDESLLLARLTLVLASRAAAKPGPVEGITRSIDNVELIAADSLRSRRLGFTGKLCIHPAQLQPVAKAFAPTPGEVAWARDVLAAVADDTPGAVAAAGQMIDKPVVERARRILDGRAAASVRSQNQAAAAGQEGT